MNLLHNLKYTFLTLLRSKTTLIWTLLFPIGLSTFMFAAFGNLFEADEMFRTIPVAVIQESENLGFNLMLDFLSADKEEALFCVKAEEKETALRMLEADEIAGIIYVSSEPCLQIKNEGIKTTIIKTVLEEYKKYETIIMDIGEQDLYAAIQAMSEMILGQQKSYYTELSNTNGVQNEYYSYFYAVFAMSCLFASFAGAEKIQNLQANESALGMRRGLSCTPKSILVFSEFLTMAIVQFLIELLVLGYLTLLGIDFGNRYPAIIVTLFFGASIGISLGMIIGSISRISSGLRSGICVCISMILSVLADLCVGGIKNSIESTMPIINRLNPAALIADSLYALNVYDTYDRYFRNILTLGILSAVMVTISFMILRRNKYASL